MQVMQLAAIPNQTFSTLQDKNQYDITIQETNGCMSATIVMNGSTVCSGQRITAGTPLIPFPYLESNNGNFVFLCNTDDTIYYTFFGDIQQLLYLSYAEMVALG